MSIKSNKSLVRIRHRFPYSGKGFEMLGETIKTIGKMHPYTQKIGPLEIGKSFIPIEELVPEGLVQDNLPRTAYEVARMTKMNEFVIDNSTEGFLRLFEMFNVIKEEDLFPGYFIVGNRARFQKWLNIQVVDSRFSVFGVPVITEPDIPQDVFLFCGTDIKDPEPENIKLSLKVALP